MNSNQQKGPQFIRFFQPIIDALIALGGSGRPEEVEEYIAERLGLSEEERNEQISSGQSKFSNKVGWARFYMAKAGLIDSSTRGVWSLTEKGRNTSLTPEWLMAKNFWTYLKNLNWVKPKKAYDLDMGFFDEFRS